jgi:hypothetical protein
MGSAVGQLKKLLGGKNVAVDSTTLEADAAMKSAFAEIPAKVGDRTSSI